MRLSLPRSTFTSIVVLCSLVFGPSAQSQDAPKWIDKDEAQNYTPRHEASFVQAGDKFYLFGGRHGNRTLVFEKTCEKSI
jgi:hypothetical protein